MPRYYFDIVDQGHLTRDAEGLPFATFKEATTAAVIAIPDIVKEALPDGEKRLMALRVRDEEDKLVYEVNLTLTCREVNES